MTTVLHAQPYDLAATGFYFETPEAFQSKAKANRNDYCDPVEEYEIQFIDGDDVDCDLAKAIGLNQGNFRDYLDCVENWEDWQKVNVIIAVGECGYEFDPHADPDRFDIDVYHVDSLRELASTVRPMTR